MQLCVVVNYLIFKSRCFRLTLLQFHCQFIDLFLTHLGERERREGRKEGKKRDRQDEITAASLSSQALMARLFKDKNSTQFTLMAGISFEK